MEKVKNILNPGHKETDELLYDTGKPSHHKVGGAPIGGPVGGHRTGGAVDPSLQPQPPIGNDGSYMDPSLNQQAYPAGAPMQTTGHQHHLGRDAALGGVGAAGFAQHQHHNHGILQGNQYEGVEPTANTGAGFNGQQNHHHLGRDAALGAGGVGLAEHEHHKHGKLQKQRHDVTDPVGDLNAQPHHHQNQHHMGRDAALGAGALGVADHEHNKHKHQHQQDAVTGEPHKKHNIIDKIFHPNRDKADNVANTEVDSTGNHHGNNHHLGRDAAIGAGAVGAGAAVHHHHKNQQVDPATGGVASTGHHHGNNHHLGEAGALGAGTATNDHYQHHHGQAATGGVGNSPIDSTSAQPGHHNHHLGRDAALGAGALGVAGHEHNSHHNKDAATVGHGSNVDTVGDHHGNKHHLGRDAAAGAGAAGLAKHEHDKHDKHHDHEHDGLTEKPQKKGLMHRILHPGKDKDTSGANTSHHNNDHHHTGRDAALGAGAVGAGVAAHEHHKLKHDKDHVDSAVAGEQNTTHHQHGHEKGGLAHRAFNPDSAVNDPASTAPPHHPVPVNAGQQPLAHEGQHHHHLGRDAALGAGATGLAGHEYNKHHHNQHQQGVMGGPSSATAGPLPAQQLQQQPIAHDGQHNHHLGRDAVLGAGAASAGLAATEHRRHQHDNQQGLQSQQQGVTGGPLSSQPVSQEPQQHHHHHYHHFENDAALGAGGVGGAGLAAQEMKHHHHQNQDMAAAPGQVGSQAIPPQQQQQPLTQENQHHNGQHHLGRDAALGAGGVGAGVAAHEHHRHHEQGEQGFDQSQQQQQHPELTKKKGGILRQIFNPNHDKHDAAATNTAPLTHRQHHPVGAMPDNTATAGAAGNAGGNLPQVPATGGEFMGRDNL